MESPVDQTDVLLVAAAAFEPRIAVLLGAWALLSDAGQGNSNRDQVGNLGGPVIGTELVAPNFAALRRGIRAVGARVAPWRPFLRGHTDEAAGQPPCGVRAADEPFSLGVIEEATWPMPIVTSSSTFAPSCKTAMSCS
jgi:hypothetical protein